MTLREARNAAGLTQRDLAKLARVCRASISHVEQERYAPSVRFAGKVCRALSAELGYPVHTWQLFPAYFCELDGCGCAAGFGAGAQAELPRRRGGRP